MSQREPTGIVFNIQRFTVHDGPGIRTEIFLKGCTLRCKWCSNPESQSPRREPGVYITKCIGLDHCGLCSQACPTGSILREEHGFVTAIARDTCAHCMRCTDVCPANALKSWGVEMTADQVMEEILADRPLMERSGGGVTFSGGEALFQFDFLMELLRRCRSKGLHTCVETALHVPQDHLAQTVPLTNLYIFDIKDISSQRHRAFTGAGNELILDNARFLSRTGKPMVVRIPIIPGHNDMEENILGIRDFILQEMEHKPLQIQFLRFRRLGEEKYASLGMPYVMTEEVERAEFEQHVHHLVSLMTQAGLPAVAGTTKPIAGLSGGTP